ncbi:serine/threonine-protein kinase VRK1-like [Diaphorina citri]|uniref:non-specific serine/threonine protein kinase n=1 Tax=Diaphorina citri TaxID=121845 RepID=A0A1S3CY16_DIACI|nr:serine/threonine-protein kinase VRK1-like [Diaphorina citri]
MGKTSLSNIAAITDGVGNDAYNNTNHNGEAVNEWKEHYKQTVLGMPHLVSFGSHFFHEKLRFLVLPRYGCDVQKKFYEFGRRFHPKTAFTLCYYIIDILEYIHSHGYVHNDMKASNLVLGCPPGEREKEFLL